MDVVQRIESHGSKSGKTSKEVRVMDCGEISAELIDGVSDTAKEVMRRQREEERAAALKTMLPGQEDPDAASARRLREMMEENKARFGRGYGSSYDKKGDEPPVRGSGMAALASAHFEKPARGPEGGDTAGGGGGGGDTAPPSHAAVGAATTFDPTGGHAGEDASDAAPASADGSAEKDPGHPGDRDTAFPKLKRGAGLAGSLFDIRIRCIFLVGRLCAGRARERRSRADFP